jgi:hypothetical protein
MLCLYSSYGQLPAGFNYEESKVKAYTLPDILKLSTGKVVKNKAEWERLQRPALLNLFAEHIYGETPEGFDRISFSLANEDKNAMAGKAILKQIKITVFRGNEHVDINLVLFIPTKLKKPAPLFLLINNRPPDNTDPFRIEKSDFWPAEAVIDQGYAIAAFHVADLAPDAPETYHERALRLFPDQLEKKNGMKAIGAWAWGASRVMDYLETDKQVDIKKVGLVGHSRGGKAALWAAAQDERFAICYSNNSGNSGAALSRRRFGETIARINQVFPHWFCDNYKQYNNNEDSLPVDQHMLIALMAPRPVYVTNASEDLWADPTGTFKAIKATEVVYNLYKIKSGLPATPPPINSPYLDSRLGYHNREGNHDLTLYDWENFIRFADINYRIKAR